MGFADIGILQYSNITTATTTLIKTGYGRLFGIQINGGTLTGTITVYDSLTATGATIATIKQPQVAAQFYQYQCVFRTGLTVKTAAAVDITIISDSDSA